MAEGFLRRRLAERGIDAHVSSAGVVAEGRPASESAVKAMIDHGIDIGDHRSRVIDPEMVARADLVVGMAREHVREAVVLVPPAFPRTFTLKELVRRGRAVGPRAASEDPGAWIARVHQGREPTMHLGSSPDDDVADPLGHRLAVFERTSDELAELVDELVGLLWPEPTAP
jgi:protein-tyrosine phosphatase